MMMFSLAGIPPLAGFFAKFSCSSPPSRPGSIVLAVIGVLASVVGAYYYLLIVKVMYFDEPVHGFQTTIRFISSAPIDPPPPQSRLASLKLTVSDSSGAVGRLFLRCAMPSSSPDDARSEP